MTTIDDKLKLFARIVFEKVEKDSELKVEEFTKEQDELLESEKKNIIKESENLIKQTRKKAEDKKRQILSKANIEKQHTLLKKRKELFDRAVEDIKGLALEFRSRKEYVPFLENSIMNGILKLQTDDVLCLVSSYDFQNYGPLINEMIQKYNKPGISITVLPTEEEILGGCIFEDKLKTVRIDCSMASVIEENKGLIGSILMDNLQ